jgi:ATP-binding cassette subfamily C protein LapB
MDDVTENKIMQILNTSITREQTLVVVTHKPTLLRLVDRIIIMTPQGIVMDGPRDEILGKIANAQRLKQEAAQAAAQAAAQKNTPEANNEKEGQE